MKGKGNSLKSLGIYFKNLVKKNTRRILIHKQIMMESTLKEDKEILKTVLNPTFTDPEKSRPLLDRAIDK